MATTPLQEAPRGDAADRSVRGPRVGIVGTGFMARVHARAALVSGADLVGVVGSSPASGAGAAAALGARRGYADLDQLLAEADVDVVHVCTPNDTHAPFALQVLASGRAVVCEKPLATTLADAQAMHEAASGCTATVPFVYRFHPMVREARARVAAGEAGRVSSLHGSYLQDWLASGSDENWRVDPARGGLSRAFGDIGSHWCDLMEFVTGDRIAQLSARTSTVLPRRGGREVSTEDVVTVQFETAAGVLGTLVVSQVAAGRKNRLHLEVNGTDTSFAFDQEQPELLWAGRRAGSQLLVRDPDAASPDAARLSRLPSGHAQGYQDCFDAFVADTYAALAGAEPEGLPRFADGARSAAVVDAVLRSATSAGAWTEVVRGG
ncbi:Gfo/Idh/MocA family protein [Angustibacter speluncae]